MTPGFVATLVPVVRRALKRLAIFRSLSIAGGRHKRCVHAVVLSQGRREERVCVRVLAARFRPSDANSFASLENRGRRECRMRAAPAVSCAKVRKKGAHEHTGSAEAVRHPLRNGFTAYFVLSPVSGLFCHRHLRKHPTGLAPASRRQDHMTSPYALAFSSGAITRA